MLDGSEDEPLRIWNLKNEKAVEASYVCSVGRKIVLKTATDQQVSLDRSLFTEDDCAYIDLSNPPQLKSTFTKQSSQRIIETTPFLNEVPPKILDYVFGAKIRQTSTRNYKHPLNVELFVVGQQRIDDQKFILLDHQLSTFIPDRDNKRSHDFKGMPVELMSYDRGQPLGRKYSDYLLVVTDERGKEVHHRASANWLFPHIDNLRKLKPGNFMDKTCQRVFPTGPGPKSLYQ